MAMSAQPFPIGQLIWPAIAIMVIGFLISLAYTRRAGLSLGVAALKSGLFLIYFGFLFDGTFTFLDDWKYLRFGEELVQNGVGIFNLMHNYDYVRSTVKSANLFYYVYDATALVIFGQDRKSTRLNSSHPSISYAVFCLKKKKTTVHIL